MRIIRILVPVIVMMFSVTIAYAGGNTAFNYQGRLLDAGVPANGLFDFEFELWDAEVAGSQIGSTQIHNAVPVTDGLFTLQIDFGANVFNNADRWLEMTVDTVLLSPRQPVTRVPYAIQTRGIFVDEDQDVGIGTTNPTSPLHVRLTIPGQAVRIESTDPTNNFTALGVTHNGSAPSILAFNSGTGHAGEFRVFNPNNAAAVRGLNQGTGNAGLFEINNTSNSAAAIYAETNGDEGIAVFGLATAPVGDLNTTFGGRFESNTPGGKGVFGWSTATTGAGTGVIGRSDSSSAIESSFGVFGWTTASTGDGTGVLGVSDSTTGTGVRGSAFASSGLTLGVFGGSSSTEGRGVHGVALASTGVTYGVLGETISTSASAAGVYGRVVSTTPGPNSAAVRGENRGTSASGIGVWGSQNGLGWGVNGTATNGTGVRGFGGAFDFFAAGPGEDYGSSSSIRWKSNVRNIDQPLEKIAKLRGVYFDWDKEHGGHHDVGMIAEEVGEIMPEIVNYEEDGIDAIGMDYSKLTPLLVEAINELHGEVEYKDSQITELQDRLTALEALVDRLILDRNGGAK